MLEFRVGQILPSSMRLFRILRGVVGTSILFAIPWSAFGFAFGSVMTTRLPARVDMLGTSIELTTAGAMLFGTFGAFIGVIFAVSLAVSGRRWTFRDLSSPRVLRLGVVAAVAGMGALLGSTALAIDAWPTTFTVTLGITTLLAGGTSFALLRLARRASANEAVLSGANPATLPPVSSGF